MHAAGRYISTLTCEHHFDHERQLRYLVDMKCEYNDTCFHRKKQCNENRHGWDIKTNECEERKVIDEYGYARLEYNETCEYEEPKQWQFDDDLLTHWRAFDVHDYADSLLIEKPRNHKARLERARALRDEYQKYKDSL